MRYRVLCLLGSTIIWTTTVSAQGVEETSPDQSKTPTEVVLASITQPDLQQLAGEVLAQNHLRYDRRNHGREPGRPAG